MPNKPMIIATQEEIAQLNASDDVAQRIRNIIDFLYASENVSPENLNDPAYLELMISQLLSPKTEGDVTSAVVNNDTMMKYYNPDLSSERQLKRNTLFLVKDVGMPPDVLASRPEFLEEVLELQRKTYKETCLDAYLAELMEEEVQELFPDIDTKHPNQEPVNYLSLLPFALSSLTPIMALPLQIADLVTRTLPTAETPIEETIQDEPPSYLLPAVATGVAVGLAGWGLYKMVTRNTQPSAQEPNADADADASLTATI